MDERGIDRRELLRRGAGFAAASIGASALAACGVGSDPKGSTQATEKVVKAKVDGDLNYFNWAEYMDPEIIKAFEKRYGVRVIESNFDSMDAMMAKLRAGNRYDVIFPSAEYTARLVKANQLLRIDREQIPNARDLVAFFDDPWYDKGAEHSVPYSMYATGIGYRADKVDGLTRSWRDLGHEQAKGRIYVLDDYQEGIGQANLRNGFDLNTTDPDQLERSKETLLEIKPLLRGFSSDTITNMVSGNAWIQHMWNGDLVNIRNQVKNPENYRFEFAREGIPVGSDVFAIPANARHPGTALLFINFLLDPDNTAANVAYTGYPMPSAAGQEAFGELVAEDPSINLTLEQLENGKQYADLPAPGRRAWNEVWTEVRAG